MYCGIPNVALGKGIIVNKRNGILEPVPPSAPIYFSLAEVYFIAQERVKKSTGPSQCETLGGFPGWQRKSLPGRGLIPGR